VLAQADRPALLLAVAHDSMYGILRSSASRILRPPTRALVHLGHAARLAQRVATSRA
jgi:hypothetical protein